MLRVLAIAPVLAWTVTAGCTLTDDDFRPETIVALEQGALDRWGSGDPEGYFDIMAEDVTYFDPTTGTRVDGIADLKTLIAPFRGKIRIDRTEILNARVQGDGDMAVLTFNLVSHGARIGDGPKGNVRWNSTEVYRRIEGRWKIVHSHWSYTKPELKVQPAE